MQRVPLAPGTQDEEHGIHGVTIINAASTSGGLLGGFVNTLANTEFFKHSDDEA